jgi:ATP-dependent DNA helicase DinG
MSRARALLGPEGPLPRAFEDYEHRHGQLEMAEAVERALDEDRVLVCEAGTGTGKTLAYLVPALACGRRIVVATASKALQEQIFFKDLPIARRVIGADVPALLVKGLGNYLCRRRFAALVDAEVSPQVRRALPLVSGWAERTARGDVAELEELAEDHSIWRLATASSDTRLGPRCTFHESCFVTALKREAQEAQVLVVNHHLLLADLVVRGDHPGSVLPDYEGVIIDEAHRLEDVATAFFGIRITSRNLERLVAEARQGTERALGERIASTATALFGSLNLLLGARERHALPADVWQGPLLEAYHALDDALGALESQLADTPGDASSSDRYGRGDPRALAASRLAETRRRFAEIVAPPAQTVTYAAREGHEVALSSSPVEVGPALRERLFERGHGVVLTSASLTVDERFSFVRARLGLDGPLDLPIDELAVASAFDHRAQALLYTPTDLPEVDDPRFVDEAAERIATLRGLTPGGTFVLCTSIRAMRALSGAMRPALDPIVQGEAPKAALLARFRERQHGVLVATMSFWEGVDVPGAALRLVVIDRLPFPVPGDPLVRARGEALERRGVSPFAGDSLPRAALVLKQGFGRLLRRRDDLGVVAILDRRICTRGYGSALVASLPPVRQTRDLEDVASFWARDEPPVTGS